MQCFNCRENHSPCFCHTKTNFTSVNKKPTLIHQANPSFQVCPLLTWYIYVRMSWWINLERHKLGRTEDAVDRKAKMAGIKFCECLSLQNWPGFWEPKEHSSETIIGCQLQSQFTQDGQNQFNIVHPHRPHPYLHKWSSQYFSGYP